MSLNQALTRPVPLRTSAGWPEYREIKPLRVGYGELSLTPIQYDTSRHFFFLFDHHTTRITSVTRGGDNYQNYELHNQADDSNKTISLIEIGEELSDDETLTVTLQGSSDPDSGELITNPAWVLYDLLTNVSGYSVERSRFLAFAEECADQSITIAGLIDNHQPTLRATIAEIMQSIGAMWMINGERIARLFPEPQPFNSNEVVYAYFQSALTAQGVLDSSDYQSDYDEAGIITELQVDYGYDWADGGYQQSVTLRADNATVELYGRRAEQIDARWLTSPAAADAMGERVLQWQAMPRWNVNFRAVHGGVVPIRKIPDGGKISISGVVRCPLDGSYIVQSKRVSQSSDNVLLSVEGVVGLQPGVSVIQRSVRSGVSSQEFHIDREGDTAIIRTNPGATVSLNGRVVIADSNGQAFFTDTPPGTYELRITLVGYEEIHMPEVQIP